MSSSSSGSDTDRENDDERSRSSAEAQQMQKKLQQQKRKKANKPVRNPLARRGQLNQDNFTEAVVARRKANLNESKFFPDFIPNVVPLNHEGKFHHQSHPYRVLVPAPDFRYIMGEVDGSKFEYCGRPELEIALIDLRQLYHLTHPAKITRHLQSTVDPFFRHKKMEEFVPAYCRDAQSMLLSLLSSPTVIKLLYDPWKKVFFLSEELQDELIELYQLAVDRNESPMLLLEEQGGGVLAPHSSLPSSPSTQRRRSAMAQAKQHQQQLQQHQEEQEKAQAAISLQKNSFTNKGTSAASKSKPGSTISPQRARPLSSSMSSNKAHNTTPPAIKNPQAIATTAPLGVDPTTTTTPNQKGAVLSESETEYLSPASAPGSRKPVTPPTRARTGTGGGGSNKRNKTGNKPLELKEGDIGKITIPKSLTVKATTPTTATSYDLSPRVAQESSRRNTPNGRSVSLAAEATATSTSPGRQISTARTSEQSKGRNNSGSAGRKSRINTASASEKDRPLSGTNKGKAEETLEGDFSSALEVFGALSSPVRSEQADQTPMLPPLPAHVTVDVHQTISEWSVVLVSTFTQFGKLGGDAEKYHMLFTMDAERKRLWERFVRLYVQPVLEDFDLYIAWQARRQAYYEAQQLLMGKPLEDFEFDMFSVQSSSVGSGGNSVSSQPIHYVFHQKDPRFLELQRRRLERLRRRKDDEIKRALLAAEKAARLEAKRRSQLMKQANKTAASAGTTNNMTNSKRVKKSTGQQIAEGMTMMQHMKNKKRDGTKLIKTGGGNSGSRSNTTNVSNPAAPRSDLDTDEDKHHHSGHIDDVDVENGDDHL